MAGKSLLVNATFWTILAVLTFPGGQMAFAQDRGTTTRPRLGGPSTRDDTGQREQRRSFSGKRDRKRGGRMGQLMEGLNLTEDQKTQVHDILRKQHEQAKTNREKNRAELEKIDAQIKELVAKKRKLMGGGPEDMLRAVRDVLNTDQQATLDKKIKDFKQGRQQGQRGRRDGDRSQDRSRRDRDSGNNRDGAMLDL